MRLPAPNPDVLAERLGEEVVLVHLGTNQIYALNETGARLWELLADGCSREEAEQALLREFDVDSAELRREIDELLAELTARDIVSAA